MGRYMSPAMTVTPGDNVQNYTVIMKTDGLNASVVLAAWVVPLFAYGEKVQMILKGKEMKVKVLGMTYSGLTMRTSVTCQGHLGAPVVTLPNSVCYPKDPKHKPDTAQEYWVTCEPGFHSITPTTSQGPTAAVQTEMQRPLEMQRPVDAVFT
jgi:hypothetical protein